MRVFLMGFLAIYNFALVGQHPRSGDVRARPRRRRSPRPQVRCRATKLFPHARCSCGTRCPWAVLLVAPQPLSRPAAFSLRTLLAVYILCAVFGILPTVGLVGRRTSLGLALASMRRGPAPRPFLFRRRSVSTLGQPTGLRATRRDAWRSTLPSCRSCSASSGAKRLLQSMLALRTYCCGFRFNSRGGVEPLLQRLQEFVWIDVVQVAATAPIQVQALREVRRLGRPCAKCS